ncbi:PKD domain-containing protein [Aureisphaera galaxeae]|uniref:PKD domain-containing protein n=1 Tax=Aureisphaera galaxeae TaxID=1538023 RepID=UPI0023505555|nr:PKD domain-containing protein [Aureisphaera galaxeae]MDC8005155.1 PKD domain-containing protein [Aureisphaera galaxeae]
MKKILSIICLISTVALFIGCAEDDDLGLVNGIAVPSNLALQVQMAQDNSGLATLTPSGESASLFTIDFGDGSDTAEVSPGSSVEHVYSEGSFEATLTAQNINGETAQFVQPITVSFLPPENLEVTVNPVPGDNFSITVSATADLAVGFEVLFGDVDGEVPTPMMIGETLTHTYPDVGEFELTVTALSGGSETIQTTVTVLIEDPLALPIDFESETVEYIFTDFGGGFGSVVDNPDPSGINTSATVGQFFKEAGAQVFAGTILDLGDPIDFSSNTAFRMDSWSPEAGLTVKLKIENALDSNIAAEVDAVTGAVGAWETLFFDFSTIDLSQEYSRIVIFYDFGNEGTDTTFYFDNIAQTTLATEEFDLVENFDGTPPVFTDFGDIGETVVTANPSIGGMNETPNSARLTKNVGAQVWGGTFFELTDAHIQFAAVKKMRLKSYSPATGKVIKLKLENADASITHEVDVNTTVANAWEELVFNFADAPDAQYNRVVVFYDFGNEGDGSEYYFDEIEVGEGGLVSTLPSSAIEDFEGTPPTFVSFGNIEDAQVVANPDTSGINTSAMSASQVKTAGSEVWAGTFFEVASPLDLGSFNRVNVMTYAPASGITIKLKLENADASITHEVDIVNSVANGWEQLSYDFSGAPSADYTRIVIFFDFGNPGDDSTYYFDEIELAN